MTEEVTGKTAPATPSPVCRARRAAVLGLVVGLLGGVVFTAALGAALMPGQMLVTHRSRLGFDETVATLEQSITDQGWVHSGTADMRASLAKHGQELNAGVKVISLCQPEYAASVLETDRYVSSLMPCRIAVWEGDDGQVYFTQMNTGLMGNLFGGNIARVMGGYVAEDEKTITAPVLEQ